MYGRIEDIIYYETAKGLVAVSLDEGETIILPSGKTMPPTEMWEESPIDLKDKLNALQLEAVEKFLAQPGMTELEQIAWRHHKRALGVAKDYKPPAPEYPEVPMDAVVVKSEDD